MIPLSVYAAAIVLYFAIGLAAWRVAERYDINGDTRLLIYGWLPVALVVAVGLWSLKAMADDMDEARAE